MKKIHYFFIAFVLLIALGLGIPAYTFIKQGQLIAKFSKIEDSYPPLTTDQVTALLGQPARIDESETTGIKGEAYYYPWRDGKDMQVVFINGTVFHAQFISETKS